MPLVMRHTILVALLGTTSACGAATNPLGSTGGSGGNLPSEGHGGTGASGADHLSAGCGLEGQDTGFLQKRVRIDGANRKMGHALPNGWARDTWKFFSSFE